MTVNSTADDNEPVDAETVTDLIKRVEALEAANEELRAENEALRERLDEQTGQRLARLEAAIKEIAPRGLPVGMRSAGLQASEDVQVDGGSSNYKILGQLADSNAGIGVLGCNTASSGATSGVKGEVDSQDDSAAGVRGVATSDASDAGASGVVGETSSPGSTGGGLISGGTIATGVSGFATNSSAVKSFGVYGSNNSDQSGTAGVFGLSFGGAGKTYGIRGETTSGDTGAAGVSGEATNSSGTVYGVSGKTIADTTDAAGVYGEATKAAGYGLLGSNTGGGYALGTNGDAEIDGALDVTKVGLSAWRRNNQTIPDDTDTTVVYDVVKEDHFDSYDESTGVYTVPVAGDYHVDFIVDWFGSFSTGDNVRYELLIEGNDNFGINVFTQVPDGISTPERSFSKTLFGLSEGDTIEVQVNQKSGSSVDIYGNGSATTYLTIHKVG